MKFLKQVSIIAICIGSLAAVAAAQGKTAASVQTEYKRLLALADRLEKIPIDKLDREPHKSFIKKNKKDIVYSDPAGQWFVQADRFWNLAKKYRSLTIADDIGWTAANTPLPGECEGYVNCYAYILTDTLGQYLKMFPSGKHRKQALAKFNEWTEPMITDRKTYDGPADDTDKADLQKKIAELRDIIGKVNDSGKEATLALITRLADAYK
ncbi:MAG: hypothetical protein ABL952_00540 [Pyrinomonadaceae bacterium]